MNWGNRKPNKSPDEIAFDKAREAYQNHFGEPYVIDFAGEHKTFEEAIAEIDRLIAEDQKQPVDDYVADAVY